ncbi:hypothetical protein [Streptomyces sp. NPDC046876]|uniref:hypothetical protein n=1 Tax=Streptomyces sp. NPDC046876 TaxID=3155616 RepID=UPI0033C98330
MFSLLPRSVRFAVLAFERFVPFDQSIVAGAGLLTSATKKQINEIKNIVDTSFDNMFQYVDLDNTQDRQRAIDLVRKIEKLRIFTGDDIGITNEKASQLIQTAILDFKRLNHLLEKNNLELSRDTVKKVEFYNWLEDRG